MTLPSSRTAPSRRAARTVRRLLWRTRIGVVAVCCGVAATTTVQALRPAPPATRDVVVTAHRLAAGAQIHPADLQVRSVPEALAPPGTLTDPADAVGRVPSVPLAAGLPLPAELVTGGATTALAPDGTVVVPVRLDDATARTLRPGDHVDLVSCAVRLTALDPAAPGDDHAPAATPAYLARRALVLPSVSRAPEPGTGTGLLGGSIGQGTLPEVTLLAVTPAEAPALSAASNTGEVAAVLVP